MSVVDKPEPTCGEDFCEACGDCLACYGYDSCYVGDDPGAHAWPARFFEEDDQP